MATQPTQAVLHRVLTTATAPDGSSFSVGYVFDADHDRHLVFADSSVFGELELLPLMLHQEIRLTFSGSCLEVLPLRRQSLEVQEHVRSQLLFPTLPPLES